ncbi:hypothetical protein QLQ15_02025 [Lysobacter sp. LF1]|uniref:Uncharacterized protein n=1 Tax=Lysobacter stagni TaxID=3045172 RepID=A0ABT6XC21_9GAMM|nr:hypothetical protein [Lysobacter sp. LF1]MDI9237685.1 hypothetical protein [Lysobacter sp. LF1]
MSARTSNRFPLTHWNAQELADAVPLRLFELIDFDADVAHAANHTAPTRPQWRQGFIATAALPALVRVR